jgi:D-3-phosphoglycerate dehydrogenase
MPTVLIAWDMLFALPGSHLQCIREAGFSLRYAPHRLLTEDETVEALQGVDAVVAGGEPYSAHVLARCPELRVIARAGVGFDRVDLEAASRRGIVVTITPTATHEGVAEHTLALLLGLTRCISRYDREIRNGGWPRTPVQPLRGRTLGIVGLGRIGRAVAVRAAAFGLRLLAWDAFPDPASAAKLGIELVSLDVLLAQADYVTLHVPLDDSTRGLINRKTLAVMKPGSYLVNTARGGLVIEEDLREALESGHLARAALDVFCQEPVSADHPLLQSDAVLLSPHIAGADTQSLADMATAAAQNIIDLYEGRWPESSVINPAVRPGWHW